MGYLQTLQLMVRAYKAARGVMPKGLDMLKLKQKARQKVIDAKKVINVDFSKGRKFYEEGIGDLIRQGKLFVGKAPKTKKIKEAVDPKLYEQMRIKEIMKQNKESAKRLEKKMNKEKDLGDRLKDYKGDPDAMREGGIISLANGGLTNISDTYDNNPTLQAQYPNKQDYLDLFTQQTTTTPQTNTTTQSTTSTIAPINPILPIIPIPESGDGGGGPPPGPRGNPNFDYETEAYGLVNLTPEQKGITQEEQDMLDKEKSGIMNLLSLSPTLKTLGFIKNKAVAGKKQLDDYFKQKAEEKAAKEEALSSLRASMARDAARNAQQDWSGSSDSYSGGMDTSTGNYDDPYDSGQTE